MLDEKFPKWLTVGSNHFYRSVPVFADGQSVQSKAVPRWPSPVDELDKIGLQ